MDEVLTLYGMIESLVPHMTGLLHAVDAFEQFHHPVLFSLLLETRRLFKVHGFALQENTMKKSSFNVKLVYVPVE